MTAPAPSAAEAATIARFGIFEAEERVEQVARAIEDACADDATWHTLAAAAIAAMPASPAEEAVRRVEALADELDQELADRGFLLDRVIRPGDRLRATLAAALTSEGERE